MDFGTEAWQLEQCRRSLAMSPPQSPAPVTCAEAASLVARLQVAEAELARRGPADGGGSDKMSST